MALQIRRGTEAQRLALAGVDVPTEGELLYDKTTKKLFIGDGITDGGHEAGYFSSVEVAGQDPLSSTGVNNALTVVAGTNITLTTNDSTNSLTINGPADYNGGIVAQLTIGEEYVADPTDSYVDFEGSGSRLMRMGANVSTFAQEFGPVIQMNAYRDTPANNDTGAEIEFRQSTLGGLDSVIATIKSVVTNVANGAEAGKLVFGVADAFNVVSIDGTGFVGNLTGDITGDVTGDVTGNVYAIDTSLIVDATNKTFNGDVIGNVSGNVTGSVVGDVKGSVFADDSTVLVDSVSGVLRGEHIGTLTGTATGRFLTPKLDIENDTISSRFGNDNIFINPAGSGSVNISSNVVTNGLQIFGPSIDGSSGDGAIRSATPIHTVAPIQIVEIHNTAVADGGVLFARGRGDIVAYQSQTFQTVQSNDSLKKLIFAGHDGTDFRLSSGIFAFVDGTVSAGYVPGRLEFATVHTDGTPITRLTVSTAAVSSTVPFKLPVYADDAARLAAVATPQQGMMIFMQSGTVPAATNQMQIFDGTNWVSL